jgi:hypothetical protein
MDEPKKEEPKELPASLSALFLNLSASALAAMGHELMPGLPKQEKNLAVAKHSIDTLDLLRAKTEGHRTAEETLLLEDLLYRLRMAFVAAGKEPATGEPATGGPAG